MHQVIITIVGEYFPTFDEAPEKTTEIVLVDAPKPPPPKILPSPKPKTPEPKRTASPKSRPKVKKKIAPQPPTPSPDIPTPDEAIPDVAPPEQIAGPPPPVGPTAPDPTPPKLKLDLDWHTFEHAFGQQARLEREAYQQNSLDRRRKTGSYGQLSARVQKALRTSQGWVQPGNQEPLGDRKKIFYQYIYMIHEQNIHPLFAEGFWKSLPALDQSHPLNDWSLNAWAEFEILANGDVSEIRVVKPSGNTVFDAAAVDSVYRSSPFPKPPKEILSWNNRVYLRWGFFRNHRVCGVFNVEPYILKAPDAQKEIIDIDEFIKTGS